MPRVPGQVLKAEEGGLGARSQAGADPGVGSTTLPPGRVALIGQSGVQHRQAPDTAAGVGPLAR